jgi:hypothetical protein
MDDTSDSIQVGDIQDSQAVAIGTGARAEVTHINQNIYQGPAYPRPDYRSEIAGMLSFYTRTFVGREAEALELARFAAQAAPGYLLVEALPGYGKSALMAHLIQRHEDKRWEGGPAPDLLYFFIRQQAKRNTPVDFLQALNAQLLELLAQPGGVPPDLTSLRAQFNQLWVPAVKAAGAARPLLLAVDGLDEMAPGEATIAGELPQFLGPYVHVVVTSRPNPEPLQQVDLAHPFKQADVLRLYALDEANIRALLAGYGASQAVAAALAPRVTAATKGEPLFARFVCQEVAAQGEAALARLEKDPPDDVEAYFRQQFDQLDDLAEGDLTWDILRLLVVALGGMSLDEIAGALGVGKHQTRKAVEPIRRFLLGDDRLELMHLQLRKVVAEDVSAAEQKESLGKLLAWCRSYREQGWPDETPAYVLTHYGAHLKAAGQVDDLYAVVLDSRFRDAQRKVLGRRQVTLADVQTALDLALANDDLVRVLACAGAYRETLRTQSVAQAISAAVQTGDFDRALEQAAPYSTEAGARTAWARVLHFYLAWEAARSGQADTVRRILDSAGDMLATPSGQKLDRLCDALLVRAARSLAGRPGSAQDARAWLAMWRGNEADALLQAHPLAGPIPDGERQARLDDARERLRFLGLGQAEGALAEGSAEYFISEERSGDFADSLQAALLGAAGDAQGRQIIEEAIPVILSNPYLRYRDIQLVALIAACLAVEDDGWVSQRLQDALRITLEQEGIAFTFDLPAILAAEAQRRNVPAWDLDAYLNKARAGGDHWGTTARASSADAIAWFGQGLTRADYALAQVQAADQLDIGMAGFGSVTLLALADRCHEVGHPEAVSSPIWGPGQNIALLDGAAAIAQTVRDPKFRAERAQLVADYRSWTGAATPGMPEALAAVAAMPGYDTRMAYICHVSARWSWPPDRPNREGLKALVPLALVDGTTLDAVLGRLLRLDGGRLGDDQVAEAVRICARQLATGRPWEFGSWR